MLIPGAYGQPGQPKHGPLMSAEGKVQPWTHIASRNGAHPRLSHLVRLASPIFLALRVNFRGRSKRIGCASSSKEFFTKDAPVRSASCGRAPELFEVSKQIGVLKIFGFFDPLGFSTSGLWKPLRNIVPRIGFSQDRGRVGVGFGVNTEFEPSSLEISEDERWFRRLREAELKHGRIAMLAALGFFSAHVVRVPGFEDAPEGIAAGLANESWQRISLLIFIFCGQFERNQFRQEAAREIGDFGDPLKLGQYTPQMRLGELVNGRLAMLLHMALLSTRPKSIADFEAALTRAESGGADVVQASMVWMDFALWAKRLPGKEQLSILRRACRSFGLSLASEKKHAQEKHDFEGAADAHLELVKIARLRARRADFDVPALERMRQRAKRTPSRTEATDSFSTPPRDSRPWRRRSLE
eukprot:Skav212174  [mRNA]  locus=scaffold754:351758:355470:+ [translate_table: standard]